MKGLRVHVCAMRCERCGADTHVEKYDVDGFTGYLCSECCEAWDRIQTDG